jgi:hypothetical protein
MEWSRAWIIQTETFVLPPLSLGEGWVRADGLKKDLAGQLAPLALTPALSQREREEYRH